MGAVVCRETSAAAFERVKSTISRRRISLYEKQIWIGWPATVTVLLLLLRLIRLISRRVFSAEVLNLCWLNASDIVDDEIILLLLLLFFRLFQTHDRLLLLAPSVESVLTPFNRRIRLFTGFVLTGESVSEDHMIKAEPTIFRSSTDDDDASSLLTKDTLIRRRRLAV